LFLCRGRRQAPFHRVMMEHFVIDRRRQSLAGRFLTPADTGYDTPSAQHTG
jgi:hypothetical protein